MSVALVIIADDLTGALDSVEPFVGAGLGAAVAIASSGVSKAAASGARVIAINTDSREVAAEEARRRVEAAWRAAASWAPEIVFKKIDSRMKGRPADETDALARASGRSRAIVCPAAPDVGRFVVRGRLVGHGTPEPIDVAERFAGLDLPATVVDHAEDGSALARYAAEVRRSPGEILPVGARGFAQALAGTFAASGRTREDRFEAPLPLLIVIGSRDPVTDTQVERLRAALPEVRVVEAPDGRADPAALAVRAPVTLLRAAPGDGAASGTVAARLGATAADFVRRHGARSLLCSGGETLAAVARALEIDWLSPIGAVGPGIPVSLGEGARGRLALISKSGGFGGPDALVEIAAWSLASVAFPMEIPA